MNNYNKKLTTLRNFGLDVTHIIEDGIIHRVKTFAKPNSRNGWYIAFPDSQLVIMGDWQTGQTTTWHDESDNSTPCDKHELRLARKAYKEAKLEEQLKCAEQCVELLQSSVPARSHTYLTNKQVMPHIAHVDRFNTLLIPIASLDGKLMSLQFIDSKGNKRFKAGAPLKGHGALIGNFNNPECILVCEGFATGCSLYEATGYPVVVAFNANNIEPVCQALQSHKPKTKLIICADNDHRTLLKTGVNIGLEKATAAANKLNATLLWPQFEGDNHGTDFNDVHCQFGIEALREMLAPNLNWETK